MSRRHRWRDIARGQRCDRCGLTKRWSWGSGPRGGLLTTYHRPDGSEVYSEGYVPPCEEVSRG